MIPNFSTYLKESVWGDLRKKSLGQEDRIEKDVNLMDFDTLAEYIKDTYSERSDWFSVRESEDGKSRHIEIDIISGITLSFNEVDGKIYNILVQSVNKHVDVPGLKKVFNVNVLGSSTYSVLEKDWTKSNNTFVKLIEFFWDKKVNESVWGDIRKKSLGQEDRIEKDVNLMDFKELHDYILDHYDYPDEAYVTFKEPEEGKFGIEAYIMNLENSPDQDFYIEYTTEYTEYSKGKPAVVIPDNIPQYLPGIYKKMDAKYDLEEFTNETIFGMSYHISIKPKTGEVNNRFFLELLDFLSDNTTSYIKKK